MPKRWTESFDFYFAEVGDRPGSIFVDLGAMPSAPVLTHPVRLVVRARMKRPNENGLRSNAEADALFQLEDRLLKSLASLDVLYVGRIISGGSTDWFFYAPKQVTESNAVPLVEAARGDYELK